MQAQYKEPELNTKECDPGCPGWVVEDDHYRIERCDVCKRFSSDQEAVSYVLALEAMDTSRHVDNKYHDLYFHLKHQVEDALIHCANDDIKGLKLEIRLNNALFALRAIKSVVYAPPSDNVVNWQNHGYQFMKLLAAVDRLGHLLEPNPQVCVKVGELEAYLDLPWEHIESIFKRARRMSEDLESYLG